AGVPDLEPEQAGQLRQAELECAYQALGIQPPRFLGYQDGTLAQVDHKEAAARIASVIRELQPQALLTWPPDGLSGHPDHIAVSRWTSEALDRMAGPAAEAAGPSPHTIALYHIVVPHSLARALGMTQLHTVPDESVTLTVDVSRVWEAKMAAIRCHRSQIKGTPILSTTKENQRLFLAVEHFRLARGQSDPLSWLSQDIVSRGKDDKA
ncbi:MAG TPA: PIG-L family deacetylase, partial [Chloroflexi bacterium]|nr:PIG-L family deacetylase [Chloroflexota bacterium]